MSAYIELEIKDEYKEPPLYRQISREVLDTRTISADQLQERIKACYTQQNAYKIHLKECVPVLCSHKDCKENAVSTCMFKHSLCVEHNHLCCSMCPKVFAKYSCQIIGAFVVYIVVMNVILRAMLKKWPFN
jgi:hypothetical protein